jgi:hypothetical protein
MFADTERVLSFLDSDSIDRSMYLEANVGYNTDYYTRYKEKSLHLYVSNNYFEGHDWSGASLTGLHYVLT